MIMRLYF